MDQTIKFLNILDSKQKKKSISLSKSYNSSNSQMSKKNKFVYAQTLHFTQNKFNQYPSWLTQREDFIQFMYENYQNKLLSIPKICQKKIRQSNQKNFLQIYLQQIPIFNNLPPIITQIILDNISVNYYKPNDIIHDSENDMEFMGVIFIGIVEYSEGNHNVIKGKNQLIMIQAFYSKKHSTIRAKTQTIILTLPKSLYKTIQSQLHKDIFQKSNEQIKDMKKSDFFIQLHLNDRKANAFFDILKPQFYFQGTSICNAGEQAINFYILFRGQVQQKNHIYIRDSNKWPLPHRKWQVRVIYNSYQNSQTLKQFSFFGDEQMTNNTKIKSTYIAKTHCILFSMHRDNFQKFLTNQDLKRLKKYRNEHININYVEFQKQIRDKIKSQHNRKKIIHKAIDTSFLNRKFIQPKKASHIQQFQIQMLHNSLIGEIKSL